MPNSTHDPSPLWLQRTALALLVSVCLYIGLLLAVLPWTHLWADNPLLRLLPLRLAAWLQMGAVRGLLSGVGLLDVWIGLQEITIWNARRKHERAQQ